MKCNFWLKGLVLTTVFTVGFNLMQEAKAQSQPEFYCGESFDKEAGKRLPTTLFGTRQGKKAIIRWETEYFGEKYSSETRCEEVSPRFQEAYDNGSLNMITNGTMDNQPVICTATESGGECNTLLMTLRKEDNPLKILNHLRDIFNGEIVGPVKHSSDTPQIYYRIDIDNFIRNAPVE